MSVSAYAALQALHTVTATASDLFNAGAKAGSTVRGLYGVRNVNYSPVGMQQIKFNGEHASVMLKVDPMSAHRVLGDALRLEKEEAPAPQNKVAAPRAAMARRFRWGQQSVLQRRTVNNARANSGRAVPRALQRKLALINAMQTARKQVTTTPTMQVSVSKNALEPMLRNVALSPSAPAPSMGRQSAMPNRKKYDVLQAMHSKQKVGVAPMPAPAPAKPIMARRPSGPAPRMGRRRLMAPVAA